MWEHHRATIARLVERLTPDPTFLAVIVGGSLTKGVAQEHADVDVLLVVTDEEYARRGAGGDYFYFAQDLCDYPGGYVDGKIIDLEFLRAAADHGSETARSALIGAFVAWSRIPDLDALIQRIPVYQEQERIAKMQAFVSQLRALHWYAGEAEKRNNLYLKLWVATRLVLFGSRLILAHNRVLFPYHKWLLVYVERAEEKPADFLALAQQLLEQPSVEHVNLFCDCVLAFQAWPEPPHGWQSRFMQDSEWNWRDGQPPLEDW